MHFRSRSELRAVHIDERDLPVSFRVDLSNHQVTVTLHRPSFEEVGGYSPIDTNCDALMEFEPSAAISQGFQALAEGRLPEGSHRGRWPPGYAPRHGQIPGQVLPEGLQESIRQTRVELHEALERTVTLIRWRLGDEGPHEALVRAGDEWSLDGQEWRPMPLNITTSGRVYPAGSIGPRARADVQSYLDDGLEAPLAHALWREAWELRGSAPRSSLLIGMRRSRWA